MKKQILPHGYNCDADISQSMVSTIRVLHVEDDPDFADLTRIYLERENDQFNFDTSTDPEDGLSKLAEQKYDCIVSDFDLPGQNGIQFLKTVRKEYGNLPFILFTGKGAKRLPVKQFQLECPITYKRGAVRNDIRC